MIQLAILLTLCASATPATPAGPTLIASPEPGWPQWRGPRRDGVCNETGLLQEWPEGGPKLLWTAEGLGTGWSGPILSGPAGEPYTIYLAGDVGNECRVFALDLEGRIKWQTANGRAWRNPYPGARASCAYRAGRLYHQNAHGRVACFDAATGKELWAVDTLERFAGQGITWGRAEGVLVDGDRVVVTPGGRKAFMAALDAKTGQTVWASPPLDDPATQRTGYASPILFRQADRRILVTLALRAVVGVDADQGAVLFTYPKTTQHDASASTPVCTRDGVFAEMPTRSGGVLLRLLPQAGGVRAERVWEHEKDSCNGSAVFKDGHLYGSGYSDSTWYAIDAGAGEEKARWKGIARGTLIWADGRLICLSERGDLVLAKPAPAAYQVTGRLTVPGVKGADCWAHPVICGGRLYLRYHGKLYCYDVRRGG